MSPASDLLSMSSPSYSESFKFPKLNGSNYPTWNIHMQSALQSRLFWLIITGDEEAPEKPDEPSLLITDAKKKAAKKEWIEWLSRDQAAMGYIKGACKDSQLPYVIESKTSKEMWEQLKTVHQTNQLRINIHYFFEELYTQKYVDGSSMADHIVAMLDLKHQIEQAGEDLPDIHVTCAMIISLPKTQSWDVIKITLFEVTKLTSVSSKLLQEANRRTREKSSDTALVAQNRKGKGHGKGGGRKPKPDDECNYCHEKGHWANKCKKREADEKAKGSANLVVDTLRDLGRREVGCVFMVTNGSRSGKSNMVLDCAATSHMFYDADYFTQYALIVAESIEVGDRRALPIVGRGSITFKSRLPNGVRTVVLHGVNHVPHLWMNLVSLGQLECEGVSGSFGGGGIKVRVGDDELFCATLSDGLYWIDRAVAGSGVAFVASLSGSL